MFCSFGTAMHAYRVMNKWSTGEFARKLGYSQASVSAWEKETRSIPADAVIKWLRLIPEQSNTPYSTQVVEKNIVSVFLMLEDIVSFYTSNNLAADEFFSYAVLQELAFIRQNYPFLLTPVAVDKTNKNIVNFFNRVVTIGLDKPLFFNMSVSDQDCRCFISWLIRFIAERTIFDVPKTPKQKNRVRVFDMGDLLYRSQSQNLIDELLAAVNGSYLYIESARRRADWYFICFNSIEFIGVTFFPNIKLVGLSGKTYSSYDWLVRGVNGKNNTFKKEIQRFLRG